VRRAVLTAGFPCFARRWNLEGCKLPSDVEAVQGSWMERERSGPLFSITCVVLASAM
jgi:hypothetical protein